MDIPRATTCIPCGEPKATIGARVPQTLIDRLDELAKGISTPWHDASRSEAIRAALERGIEVMEQEARADSGVPRP